MNAPRGFKIRTAAIIAGLLIAVGGFTNLAGAQTQEHGPRDNAPVQRQGRQAKGEQREGGHNRRHRRHHRRQMRRQMMRHRAQAFMQRRGPEFRPGFVQTQGRAEFQGGQFNPFGPQMGGRAGRGPGFEQGPGPGFGQGGRPQMARPFQGRAFQHDQYDRNPFQGSAPRLRGPGGFDGGMDQQPVAPRGERSPQPRFAPQDQGQFPGQLRGQPRGQFQGRLQGQPGQPAQPGVQEPGFPGAQGGNQGGPAPPPAPGRPARPRRSIAAG